MTRNKELEAVLEPKEGEEVVLYEVLDKDIKPPSAKTRSHRKDSQSEQCDEVSPVIVNDLIGAYFQITASCLINAPSTLLTLGRARKFIPPPWYKGWGGGWWVGMEPLPGVFDMLQYFKRILPLMESN